MKTFRSLVHESQRLKPVVLVYEQHIDKSFSQSVKKIAEHHKAPLVISDCSRPILSEAKILFEQGYDHLILAGSYKALIQSSMIKQFNGVPNSYNFEKFTTHAESNVSNLAPLSNTLRESYVQKQYLTLGETVVDIYTGVKGKVVYRGPTYVTVQVNENFSFKRWVNEVTPITENTMDSLMGFINYAMGKPNVAPPDERLLTNRNNQLRLLKNFRKMEV